MVGELRFCGGENATAILVFSTFSSLCFRSAAFHCNLCFTCGYSPISIMSVVMQRTAAASCKWRHHAAAPLPSPASSRPQRVSFCIQPPVGSVIKFSLSSPPPPPASSSKPSFFAKILNLGRKLLSKSPRYYFREFLRGRCGLFLSPPPLILFF